MECQMCDEWNQKRGIIKLHKRHVYKTYDQSDDPIGTEEVCTRNQCLTRRAIRYWLYNCMEQAPYTQWNIDDYDGEVNYQECQLELFEEFRIDDEIGAE